jgi:hypothetical protein
VCNVWRSRSRPSPVPASPLTRGTSRHDDTQAPRFALLVLTQVLEVDDRGLVTPVAEWAELRRALGLAKVPHSSTLCYAQRRLLAGAENGGSFNRAKRTYSMTRARPPAGVARDVARDVARGVV